MWRLASRRRRLEQDGLLALLALGSMLVRTPTADATAVEISIAADADDGEELDDSTWVATGTPLTLGRTTDGRVHDLALRFNVPTLVPGEPVLWARLRFSSTGGFVADSLPIEITGVRETTSPALDQDRRPSRLPRTAAQAAWTLRESWRSAQGNALFYYSPDLSTVLNEILTLPGWGAESPALVLCLDDGIPEGTSTGFVGTEAYDPARWPVTLQVARTIDEAFLCHEALARPTDHAVTVHFTPLVAMEVFVTYSSGGDEISTTPKLAPAGAPCRIVLEALAADAGYLYQLQYRLAGSSDPFRMGPVHAFHTQRAPGSSFVFTTEADSHLWDRWQLSPSEPEGLALYQIAQENIRADAPDFHLSLGDFSMTEFSPTRENAFDRYTTHRRFLDATTSSAPFYLVLGNHEGELGWKYVKGDSIPVRAESARLETIPNPFPDGFYDGCADSAVSEPRLRESYYAWEWGDALFVVLDPFWNTTQRPYHTHHPNPDGGWKWTLGRDQYEWLYRVLHASNARWKIVLLHHLVGGVEGETGFYGRGGIEAVKWAVAHRPSFEWGGEDHLGHDVFDSYRPGWNHAPIHDLLRNAGVQLVIHGHDHFCAVQSWDGLTYVLCPQPSDANYGFGAIGSGEYTYGILRANSGHLRFRVSPDDVIVQYLRAYNPGDGVNRSIAVNYSLTSGPLAVEPAPAPAELLRIRPNPAPAEAEVEVQLPARAASPLRIFDVTGRLRATLPPVDAAGPPGSRWDLRGERLPSGVYWCRVQAGGTDQTARLVLLR